MQFDRRQMIAGSAGLGAGIAVSAGVRVSPVQAGDATGVHVFLTDLGVQAGSPEVQTEALQNAIDGAAKAGKILFVPAGEYRSGRLDLPRGCQLHGVPGQSILKLVSANDALVADDCTNVRLIGITIDGGGTSAGASQKAPGLIDFSRCEQISIRDCTIMGSAANGISLNTCSGHVTDCRINTAAQTGIFSIDATVLEISHNHVHDCRNNGIQVWRSGPGEDGTIVASNRVDAIGAADGGSGQNGNGINVFRAGSVQVSGNRISNCIFTAIRGNAVSNFLVTGNNCSQLGEVAIYAEFGFDGTIISSNLVDKAASGISVTNFNEGGRLAVIQGNLVRNMFMREGERGVGIAVEADAMVSGNVVEGAPGGGIMIGWGKYLRDVNVTGNLVREARIGIGVSAAKDAGYAYITNNMLSLTAEGGIRAMDHNKPLGSDLAKNSSESYRNMAVFGNVSL